MGNQLKKSPGIVTSLAVAALLAVCPRAGMAAGFALLEQSAEGTGFAFAGATAGYDDGSAIFFNPGAMGATGKTTFNAGGSFIVPQAKFSNEGSHTAEALGGAPLIGDNGPDGGKTAVVGNLYLVHPMDNGLTLGFGVNNPFGLVTDYSRTWVGRYSSVTSDLRTVSLSPAASYEVFENFSIGAAVNVTYADAKLSNMVDFGTIGVATLGLPTASRLGLLPQTADGFAKVNGDDWGVGATAGASYTYCDNSRIGIAYRSPIDFTLNGDARFEVPQNARVLTSTGAFTNTGASADLTLPDSIAIGWIHELNDEWTLLGDAQWTHWSRFKELRVEFDSVQPDSVVNENWNDVWRYSIGTEYRATDDLRLRLGFTWDQDPIADAQHRTSRIPGDNRFWLAFGGSYNFTDSLRLDLGYAHLFINDAHSDTVGSTGDTLQGSWDLSVDIYSAQLVYTM